MLSLNPSLAKQLASFAVSAYLLCASASVFAQPLHGGQIPKDSAGRVLDILRIDRSFSHDGRIDCPKLTYRLRSLTGDKVVASYETANDRYRWCVLPPDSPALKQLPPQLHTLYAFGDTSFLAFPAHAVRTTATGASVKVLTRPQVWLEQDAGYALRSPEEFQVSAIKLEKLSKLCIDAPSKKRDCTHQPKVLAAIKEYKRATKVLYDSVPTKLPRIEYVGMEDDEDWQFLWIESNDFVQGPRSPYAKVSLSSLALYLDLPNSFARVESTPDLIAEADERLGLAHFELALKDELQSARNAFAHLESLLKGKTPLVRLRNGRGTEVLATERNL